jgi:mono/diheme cytochrome c family protein
MRHLIYVGALAAAIVIAAGSALPASADANSGAALVQQNGCQGCHGANLQGSSGYPALYGIERRLSHARIVDAILNPKPPMPKFAFSSAQASSIADYLSSLDGGAGGPTIAVSPAHPSSMATVTVHFPGAPPMNVQITATMSMGASTMSAQGVTVMPSSDHRTYTARIPFSMGGPWTLHVRYDGKHLDQPIVVGQ